MLNVNEIYVLRIPSGEEIICRIEDFIDDEAEYVISKPRLVVRTAPDSKDQNKITVALYPLLLKFDGRELANVNMNHIVYHYLPEKQFADNYLSSVSNIVHPGNGVVGPVPLS